jgi:hypothetical protein
VGQPLGEIHDEKNVSGVGHNGGSPHRLGFHKIQTS